MDNVLAGFQTEDIYLRGPLLNIPCLGVSKYGGVFYRGCHAILPPGDIFEDIPNWDVGEIG